MMMRVFGDVPAGSERKAASEQLMNPLLHLHLFVYNSIIHKS